jgi:4-oxalomesaconate tautomerase
MGSGLNFRQEEIEARPHYETVMQTAISCTLMRGGTSKGAYFVGSDLPSDVAARDRVLMAVMGSPDPRQIDGVGGADPLTSKVAIVSKSTRPGIDVDYLFCQVWVDKAEVSTQQNCGNILSGVAPFAIERGLVGGTSPETVVRIFMVNTSQTVVATVQSPGGRPRYDGDTAIDGVPGTAAPIPLSFADTAGSTCGALLPTGRAVDVVNGVRITCIDNGMPVVVMRASDLDRTGYESRDALDKDTELKARIEAIRLLAGPMMRLGDVATNTVPKMILVSPPRDGGAISTRSFIPHRCHATIGVFAALSVATACHLPEGPAREVAVLPSGRSRRMLVEHPTGASPVLLTVEQKDGRDEVTEGAIISTARALFDGRVLVPERVLVSR